jgi:hypothetical protein
VGHPFLFVFKQIHKKAQEGRTCRKSNEHLLKDVPVKAGAGFLICTVSFIKGLKEERFCKTKDHRKKGVMAGLESANGQV